MKFEVRVLCAICFNEIRRYTTTQKPPGDIKLEAHADCEAAAVAEVERQYAMDSVLGRSLELN